MNYSKAWGMVVATVLSAVLPLLVDGALSATEWITVALAAAGAVTVAIVPNLTGGVAKYAKGAVAITTAVLTLLVTVIDGGLTTPEILQLVIAALGAVGVVGLPGPQHETTVTRPAGTL